MAEIIYHIRIKEQYVFAKLKELEQKGFIEIMDKDDRPEWDNEETLELTGES